MAVSWSTSNTNLWEKGFAALSKFSAREGHCCPSYYHMEGDFKLGSWVSRQRVYKNLLLAKRKRRLDAIGFVWDCRDHLWEQGFTALLKFKRREGHCLPSRHHVEGNFNLGPWVSTQRLAWVRAAHDDEVVRSSLRLKQSNHI